MHASSRLSNEGSFILFEKVSANGGLSIVPIGRDVLLEQTVADAIGIANSCQGQLNFAEKVRDALLFRQPKSWSCFAADCLQLAAVLLFCQCSNVGHDN